MNDLLFGLVSSPAPADSGALSVADLPAGDLDFDQVIADLLSGLDATTLPAGEALFAPAAAAIGDDNSALLLPAGEALFAPAAVAVFGDDDSAFLLPAGEGLLAPAAAAAIGNDGPAPLLPATVDDALFLGLFDLDAAFDGIVPVPPAAVEPAPIAPAGGLEPDEGLDELLLGLLALDATIGDLVFPPAGAAAHDSGVATPPLAVAAAPAYDVGVILPPVVAGAAADDAAPDDAAIVPDPAAAVPPAAPAVQENDEVDIGEAVPMDVDSDDEDSRDHDDPMVIQEDATMTLRRGGWRRVTPVLVHGRRRRVMALPLGVPARRFAGPYTIPRYQGSSSNGGRRRNTQTGALVAAAF
jgi:hypothetical protein